MKVVVDSVPEMSIDEFADRHGLVMRVRERAHKPVGSPQRFFASFNNVEVKDRGCLVSVYGDGRTPEDAIDAYARALSRRPLVVNAFRESRKDIKPHTVLAARTQEGESR